MRIHRISCTCTCIFLDKLFLTVFEKESIGHPKQSMREVKLVDKLTESGNFTTAEDGLFSFDRSISIIGNPVSILKGF